MTIESRKGSGLWEMGGGGLQETTDTVPNSSGTLLRPCKLQYMLYCLLLLHPLDRP